MAKLVTITLYGNPFVKKKVVNPYQETFTKPAIIISNHSSTLDTLTIGLLTHNIIYLVNDWVYKSPIFGLLARVLGFYPISNGIDKGVEHLRKKLNQGYCLVVFPEGKRSFTNKIGRFKKGAFFLAQQLEIDILPIYLHGNAEVAPKKDFIFYDGSLTAEVGKRIPFDELKNYGNTDREITKNIATKYKNQFLKIRERIETSDYFKHILFSNYHYKSNALAKIIETDFKNQKNQYHTISELLPMQTTIVHWADDYGQMDILLVAKSLDRKITTFINSKEKRSIARNCYSSTQKGVKYISSISEATIVSSQILLISKELTHKEADKVISFNYPVHSSVILINNSNLVNRFCSKGFAVKHTTKAINYLTKD